MTDHATLEMHREYCRVSDRDMIDEILRMTNVCSVAFHDEPFPYVIQMNYGYEWEGPARDQLVFYMHFGMVGHKFDLIAADPRVAVAAGVFLNRGGHRKFRNEPHDFRSVHGYGRAEVINGADERRWLVGINAMLRRSGWPELSVVTEKNKGRLQVLRVPCEFYTAKAQYAIDSPDIVQMPSVEDVDAGIPADPFRTD